VRFARLGRFLKKLLGVFVVAIIAFLVQKGVLRSLLAVVKGLL
jgi:hypothetical protein